MRIRFGVRSYKIKEFDSKELGLTEKDTESFPVQLRQDYFHILFIPFFGLGKKWVIIEKGEMTELPFQYKRILEKKEITIHRPWYNYLIMFIGPIIILLTGLGIYSYAVLGQKYVNYKSQKKEIAKTYERLDNPNKNDYYLFCGKSCYTLKIDSLTQDSVLFSAPIPKKSNKAVISYNEAYIDDTINNPTKKIWVEKSIIAKAYGAENTHTSKFNGVLIGQLNFLFEGNCKMVRIRRRLYNPENGFRGLD